MLDMKQSQKMIMSFTVATVRVTIMIMNQTMKIGLNVRNVGYGIESYTGKYGDALTLFWCKLKTGKRERVGE